MQGGKNRMSKSAKAGAVEAAPVRESVPSVRVVVESVKCPHCSRAGDHEQYGSGKTSSGVRYKYFVCAFCGRKFRANFKEYSAGGIFL